MTKTTMARKVTTKSRPAARVVVVKSRGEAIKALDRQTKAIVGKPSREAFRLLDSGKLQGTIAEIHLKMLRHLTA